MNKNIKKSDAVLKFTFLLFVMSSSILASWQLETIDTDSDALLRSMVMHSSGNLVIVGDDNTIIVSQNNGKRWEEADIPDVSGFGESDDISIRNIIELPISHKLLALGVIDKRHSRSSYNPTTGTSTFIPARIEKWTALLASSDGGETWEIEDKVDDAALYWLLPFSDGQCILFGYSANIYEYKNGKAVTIAENTLSTSNSAPRISIPFAGEVIINEKRQITQYNDLLFTIEERKTIGMSLDRGQTWALLQSKGGIEGKNGIAVIDEHSIVGVGDNGFMALSQDAGINWNRKKIADNDLSAVFASSQCDWWIVGDEGYVAYSQNSGNTWIRLESDCEEDLTKLIFNNDKCDEGWILGKEGTLIHLFDDRKGNSVITREPTEQKVSWTSRAANDVSEWYKNVTNPDELSQGLLLTVKPYDAKVQIADHSYSGERLLIALPPGKYSLMVSKEGYFSEEDSVEIGIGSVEEEDIVLRPIKIVIAPSGAMISSGRDWGILFSFQAGVLGNRRNSAGLLLDAGTMVMNNISFVDLCTYYSYRFDVNKNVFLSPFVAVGGVYIKEMSDSVFLDTSYLPAHFDTLDNGHKAIFYDAVLQAGLDINICKNQNCGFSIKPSLFWSRRLGYQFIMRFGAIIWIL